MNKLWTCSKSFRFLFDKSSILTTLSPAKSLHSSCPALPSTSRLLGNFRSVLGQTLVQTAACRLKPALLQHPNVGHQQIRLFASENTNLAKDVLIYKYENPSFFKYLNIFAYCQFIFWGYLAHFAYTELRDVPVDRDTVDENTSWWLKINLGDDKYRTGMTVFCLGVGYIILALSWLYTLRSVRFLVLRKGGQSVTMVMYGPFGRNRMMNVPLNCISAQDAREAAKVVLPLKLKGARMYYMLDMRGEFLNTKMFDLTVGTKRNFD